MSGIEGYHEGGMDPGSDPSEDTDTQMHGGGRLPLGGLQLLGETRALAFRARVSFVFDSRVALACAQSFR
jgi:hypothetical protein